MSATTTPLPVPPSPDAGERVTQAWRQWLSALATDAEAAHAAAMAYMELDASARVAWLDVLERDAQAVNAPTIALYAPLLAVEVEVERRERIEAAIAKQPHEAADPPWALAGTLTDGQRVAAIVAPLYLDFAHVLGCGYRPGEQFVWVRHDPIVCRGNALAAGDRFHGALLAPIPVRNLVDELALTVLAQSRRGEALPEPLRLFSDLFGPMADNDPQAS